MSDLRRRDLLQRSASALLSASLASTGLPAFAQSDKEAPRPGIELTQLEPERGDDGLLLSYTVHFVLPQDLEDALLKGVALVFVADAELYEERWYWSDKRVGRASRRWRLAYQPLTRRWRLSFDSLSRWYTSLHEALAVMSHASQWRIARNVPRGEEEDHYVVFSLRLDTDELPRPLQIGLGGESDWARLAVSRYVKLTHLR